MEGFIKLLGILLILILVSLSIDYVYAEPPYAKWGKLAMKEVKAAYPNADIVDYLHKGKRQTDTTSIQSFKLWLIENEQEFGVVVDIEFDSDTEEIVDIIITKQTLSILELSFHECVFRSHIFMTLSATVSSRNESVLASSTIPS
ncbi:hypothetical protein JNUCC1_00481 [Lentibacillus sp. JNUCC-1]|uniref:DUF3889 domain-containing protein n=1 Tax=Lentibacillus sp. JNUCC-1 TaxID=2654513 RepID=UPI0013223A84|nr:DUF3889 domain-containing protein [Lentibacillus sp. JNUCC-1]MUV36677.1 hypothetical protein [Lentibacillus sp. JNUCC-1]